MKAPTFLPDCLPRIFLAECGPKGGRGASGKPPAFLPEYLYPVGFSANYGPKGTGGNEGKRVPSGHNRRRRLATRSSGKQQAERTAVRTAPIVCPEESPQCARRCIALPLVGIDAPTPAREKGLQPYGALTLFFRWRKKSVQKKASGTATPGKSPLLPILAAGLAMSRAAELASYACYRARSELAFFRRQNGRAFFPPLPIAALLPRSWRWAGLPLAGWDASMSLGYFCSADE